jgi:hypothetical protein
MRLSTIFQLVLFAKLWPSQQLETANHPGAEQEMIGISKTKVAGQIWLYIHKREIQHGQGTN